MYGGSGNSDVGRDSDVRVNSVGSDLRGNFVDSDLRVNSVGSELSGNCLDSDLREYSLDSDVRGGVEEI